MRPVFRYLSQGFYSLQRANDADACDKARHFLAQDRSEEEIKNFRSDENTCSFQMEGISELKLSISKKIPYSQISLIALDSPIEFILECHISEKNGKSHAQLEVNAELNMITKMMVEKPIKDFINVLSEKLKFI